MRKRWGVYVMVISAAGLGALILCAFFKKLLFMEIALAVLFLAFAAWWTAYYAKWSCYVSDNEITVKSGVFFKNIHVIPTKSVLWTTRAVIRLPNGKNLPLFTLLHTGGGKALVFGELLC